MPKPTDNTQYHVCSVEVSEALRRAATYAVVLAENFQPCLAKELKEALENHKKNVLMFTGKHNIPSSADYAYSDVPQYTDFCVGCIYHALNKPIEICYNKNSKDRRPDWCPCGRDARMWTWENCISMGISEEYLLNLGMKKPK